ncbi:MAG: recombination protein O N-terminal domain-containing protein [Candidatus Paceibacterota bacterium]|jgi:DNA repair protein RecO
MSYAITTTPGFVISSQPYGDAGKILNIFTRDLGLVAASAQGIRLEKSKLRYATPDYSFGTFSFVRGKEFWRLTDAKSLTEAGKIVSPDARMLVACMAFLLKRLLQGESPHVELFGSILSLYEFLAKNGELDATQMETLESLVVTRILERLGYIGRVPDLRDYIGSDELDADMLNILKDKRKELNMHINKALRESHL